LRLEVGPRDAQADQVVAVRRDLAGKQPIPAAAVVDGVRGLLEEVQRNLFAEAKQFLDEHTFEASSWAELEHILETSGGFVWVNWCDSPECERALAGIKATVRAIPLQESDSAPGGPCVCCGNAARFRAVVARSY
jgi:prolyl-tRNA synthetase